MVAMPSFLLGASFEGLGDLSGGDLSSEAVGIAADGSVVVGKSESALGMEGFRWTETGGLTGLGDLSGGDFKSVARGVSGDGSVVVGEGLSISGGEAFRWTEAGGLTGLGDLAGGVFKSEATGVSSDGSVIVGGSASDAPAAIETFRWTQAGGRFSGGSGSAEETVVAGLSVTIAGLEAFRWTQAGGMVGLGDLTGGSFFSLARGVSSDGSVVVGRSESESGMEAFLWTEAGGMAGLGDLAGGSFFSLANGVSSDGSIVVGRSESASGIEAFRWTEAGGMTGLGDLAGGGYFSEALGVSADGSVIVGWSTPASGEDALEAYIWDAGVGMSALKSVLEIELGLDLTGWTLIQASAVSEDGLKIAGWGTNPGGQKEAWVADLTTIKGDQIITFNALENKVFDDPSYSLSASANSGLSVSYSVLVGAELIDINENTVTISGVGSVTIRAGQAGNRNFNPAPPVDRSFAIGMADQIITFNPIGNSSVADSPLPIFAVSSSGLPVSFTVVEGATIAAIVGSTVTLSGEGQINIEANQEGSENYLPALPVEQSFLATFGPPLCEDVFCGEDIPGFPGWQASPWYLNYNVDFMPWIFHDEHGWQFVSGENPQEIFFLWDLGLAEWIFLDESTYRWMFLFGDNPGWIFTFPDNTPERRFFQRSDDGSLFSVPEGLPVE